MFLDQSFPPDSRVENEASTLIGAGHEVIMYSLNFNNLKPEVEEVNGIKVYRQTASNMLYRLSALAYTIPFFHQMIKGSIKRFIKEINPDALHVHDMPIAKAVMDVNDQFFGLPVTLDLHENRPEILRYYPHLNRFPGKFIISLEKWRKAQAFLMQRADHVVLVTDEAINEAVRETGEPRAKFLAVPNTIKPGIFMDYPTYSEVEERFATGFNLIYVGDTGLRRGLGTAIEALSLIVGKIPEVRLIVVGKSTQDDVLREMIMKRGLESHVCFEGWQDVSKFRSYINVAHVGLSPLHRNKHHDTTLANKIFQYMACACPVLVSDCPAQVSVIKAIGCGAVFESENAEAMAHKLLQMYKEPEKRRRMGELGQEAVNGPYSWDNMSKNLSQHYDTLESRIP